MSEAISALAGANNPNGFAAVAELGLHGMITVRGDQADAGFAKAVCTVAGVEALPEVRKCVGTLEGGVAWMSPDELMVFVPYSLVVEKLEELNAALDGSHFLAVNVSDARAVFGITGPKAREVIAKLAPVDLSPEAFGVGDLRRTRLAQIAAAFWMNSEDSFRLVCFRSVAEYAYNLLAMSASAGSEVDYF
ncbi:sarcosine oxidase subunit gamma [Donghicola tyrosinivorans]|uniref:Sarcosine oxidase subunit gamma n=1 Tax=Donghicola tyrosinivorans TaxID=1652492 RepID=A0A2T0WU56_9RHOB|nr:sarcosine oxidase subunit gamma family protein [Donghicola tyrosinivorans]PRY90210.1 sarcosine oxidase subunit gamma [Donghicola tyrosinivorans]